MKKRKLSTYYFPVGAILRVNLLEGVTGDELCHSIFGRGSGLCFGTDFDGKDQLNVKLKLDYKNNISLYVNGRISIGSSPKGVDLSSEITKRSIWPVTI